MTGQFGKNHLGDRDRDAADRARVRRVLRQPLSPERGGRAGESPTIRRIPSIRVQEAVRPARRHSLAAPARWQADIEDTGPLTKKRMETIDEEVTAKALDFMERAKKADKPFFLWWNSTRMHVFTHLKKESAGKTGLGIYADGMVEHDGHGRPGARQAQGTGPRRQHHRHVFHRQRRRSPSPGPTAARRCSAARRTRNGKAAIRVPTLIRWPGVIKPGTVINDIGCARGHAADPAGRRGRHHRQGRPAEGQESRRHDLQGPSRRL